MELHEGVPCFTTHHLMRCGTTIAVYLIAVAFFVDCLLETDVTVIDIINNISVIVCLS